jgi:hypothetical protein
VFGLRFHFGVLLFFPFTSMCFSNAFVLLLHLFVVNLLLVNCYSLRILCTMIVTAMKEGRLLVGVDDLDFRIKHVVFETKVLNMYGTFD